MGIFDVFIDSAKDLVDTVSTEILGNDKNWKKQEVLWQIWLKGLPQLKPTNIVTVSESTKVAGNWFNKGGKERQKNRSKTFEGIAKAMATQWSEYILKEQEVQK